VLRFQVGYFAKEENASRLKAELAGKGIVARIDRKDSGEGQRWTVVVDAGPDPQRTSLRLKDAGYESYPQF
jgi:cell division protein FtsN